MSPSAYYQGPNNVERTFYPQVGRFSAGTGFSLLEVILALVIAALMAIAGYRGLSLLADSNQRLAQQSEHWRSLDRLFARLDSDLRKAVPRSVRGPGGDEPAMWMADTTTHPGLAATTLRFSRAGSENSLTGLSAGQRIEYRLHEHAIELAYWPYLDNPPNSASTVYSLLDGIAAFRVTAYSAAGVWSNSWPLTNAADVNALPRAVHVELALDSGETIERWFTFQP